MGDGWMSPELAVDEDGRRASRFRVTRPAVVDLGLIHVQAAGIGCYTMTFRASSLASVVPSC